MKIKEMQDDYCDIYEKKICDNCGKCLEEEGVDIRAIKIEDIAKKVEENESLEAEYRKTLIEESDHIEVEDTEGKEDLTEDLRSNIKLSLDNEDDLKKAYEKLSLESGIDFSLLSEEEYEDAFDHIEYIEDYDLFDDSTLEEMTVEVFPGVRRLKGDK